MLYGCSEFTESLSGNRLLDDFALNKTVKDIAPQFTDAKALGGELVRRGWLTPFQIELILHGRGNELLLGQYVMIDLLGEGGMGAVYKARHRVLKAVRAIKVIRPDRMTNPNAVDRFYREIEAVAKLHHPNIILAHDANQENGIHYLVMEYAAGADLGRLVQMSGPLPIPDACEYIRQAALGLQHAHERGLVHRDIKPSNLLVTGEGQVKLLDLGLARVRAAETEDATGISLTQDGAVMGTPDYMAPEQAQDSKSVDIRADIYSLGCTLYHILTGRPPFPQGSVMEKLLHHRLDEPASIELLRPDTPAELVQVVRKMMAKERTARYATPGEVAAVLVPFCVGAAPPDLPRPTESLLGGPHAHPTVGPTSYLPGHAKGSPAPNAGTLAAVSQPGESWTQANLSNAVTSPPQSETVALEPRGGVTQPAQPGAVTMRASATTLPTDPNIKSKPKKRSFVGLFVGLIALGLASGAIVKFALPQLGKQEKQVADLSPIEPRPSTVPETHGPKSPSSTPPTSVPVQSPATAPEVKPVPMPEKHTPTPPPPPPPPAKTVIGEARLTAGPTNDLVTGRGRGSFLRTQGRDLSWLRYNALVNFPANSGPARASFSATADRAIITTKTDGVSVFSLNDRQPPATTSLGDLTNGLSDSNRVNAATLSPDGTRVILAAPIRSEKPIRNNGPFTKYSSLAIWSPGAGDVEVFYGPAVGGRDADYRVVACAPDGKEAVAAGTLTRIDRFRLGVNDHETSGTFKHGMGDHVLALAYSPEGQFLASGGLDKHVCIFDAGKSKSSAPLVTLEGKAAIQTVALSPDARFALAGCRDGSICLWDVGDPTTGVSGAASVFDWLGREPIKSVAFSSSGRNFAVGSEDGTVCIGTVGQPRPLWREVPRSGAGGILALAFSPDGALLYVIDEIQIGTYSVMQEQGGVGRGPASLETGSIQARDAGKTIQP